MERGKRLRWPRRVVKGKFKLGFVDGPRKGRQTIWPEARGRGNAPQETRRGDSGGPFKGKKGRKGFSHKEASPAEYEK